MKIYLAIPYTWNEKKSYEIANKISARLMEAGHVVFSPISHSHSIGKYVESHTHEFWMEQDLPFVDWCEEIYVVLIGEFGDKLIAQSKGVQAEIAHARKLGKKIEIYDYYE